MLCFGFTESSSIQPSRTSYVSSSTASVNRGKSSTDAEKVSNEWLTDQERVYFVNVGLIINRGNFLSFPVLYPRYHVIMFGIVGRRCWTVCSAPYKTQPPEIFIKIDGRQDIEIHRFRNIFYNEWEVQSLNCDTKLWWN